MLDTKAASTGSPKKVWIDLDNSPHVPFFKPIVAKLDSYRYEVSITTRNCFQVSELADLLHLRHTPIGRHYGKNKLLKILGTFLRSLQMLPFTLRLKPSLALSHGSRSQLVVANALRIPSVEISDYEYAQGLFFARPTLAMVPELIPDKFLELPRERFRKYPGIKEDVYAPYFELDSGIMGALGLSENDLVVTIRPPASEAHYYTAESGEMFKAAVEYVGNTPGTRMIMLPRNRAQEVSVKETWKDWCESGKILIPKNVVNGLNLIWHSDLVISGGGTMNREAAALGVPVYSIFRGKIGAVDRYLSACSRLTLVQNVADIPSKIALKRHERTGRPPLTAHSTLDFVVNEIVSFLERPGSKLKPRR